MEGGTSARRASSVLLIGSVKTGSTTLVRSFSTGAGAKCRSAVGRLSPGARPAYDRGVTQEAPKTWILTGSLENFRINVERSFDVIGLKERRVRQAEQFQPDDLVIFYVTVVKAFGGIARVLSPMFEDREPIWPQGKKKVHEDYPWRVQGEPVLVLDEDDFVPAESLLGEMEHLSKWPAEHWTLAFQGQLRTVSDADSGLLEARMSAAARTAKA